MIIQSDNISDNAIDFSPFNIHSVEVVEVANPHWNRKYFFKIDSYTDGTKFVFSNPPDGNPYDFLDNIRTYDFVLDSDSEYLDITNFYVNAVSTPVTIPAGTVIDYSKNNKEDIPNYFENSNVLVNCTPKWETPTTDTVKFEIKATGEDEMCEIRLMKDFTAPFIFWYDGEDIDGVIGTGNLDDNCSKGSGMDINIPLTGDDTVLYIRGDLTKLYGLKISTNGKFKVTGLKNAIGLEMLDTVYPTPIQEAANMVAERTIDFVPANVKYLYLDYVSVENECLSNKLEIASITGYSKCFTDIANYINDKTMVLRYYSRISYDSNNGDNYGDIRFSVQKWCADDLRVFNAIGRYTVEDVINFQKSVEYLEPKKLWYGEDFYSRFVAIYPIWDCTDAIDYWNSEDVQAWRDNINNRFPDYVIGEY